MRKLVYDVAVSLDGYISGPEGSIEAFLGEGEHAADYWQRLQGYDTVLMGRATYEAGYPFGLQPGERAYPHMEHYIVSSTLRFEGSAVHVVDRDAAAFTRELKAGNGSDIYLCGGGRLAGYLLDEGLVDRLVLKLNPIVLGSGVRLFAQGSHPSALQLTEQQAYDNGVVLLQYDLAGSQA